VRSHSIRQRQPGAAVPLVAALIRTWQRVCFDATLLHLTLEPPFPGSYLAAVTDVTEMVSPLAVPVTLASSQASLLRLSSAA
jgi:hypothetical protein